MSILLYNIFWMSFNLLLAMIAIFFGWLMVSLKMRLFKIISFVLWLFFIPNTIYIITDIYHFSEQWYQVSGLLKLFLLIQYALLFSFGIVTFIFAFYTFEKFLIQSHFDQTKKQMYSILILTNILIAFGVVLGRVQRTNSWYIITDPQRVLIDATNIFYSNRLILLVFLFSLICNLVYFSFKKEFINFFKNIKRYKGFHIFLLWR